MFISSVSQHDSTVSRPASRATLQPGRVGRGHRVLLCSVALTHLSGALFLCLCDEAENRWSLGASRSWDCQGPLPGFRAQGSQGGRDSCAEITRLLSWRSGQGTTSRGQQQQEPTLPSFSTADRSGVSSGAVWSEPKRSRGTPEGQRAGQNLGRGWHGGLSLPSAAARTPDLAESMADEEGPPGRRGLSREGLGIKALPALPWSPPGSSYRGTDDNVFIPRGQVTAQAARPTGPDSACPPSVHPAQVQGGHQGGWVGVWRVRDRMSEHSPPTEGSQCGLSPGSPGPAGRPELPPHGAHLLLHMSPAGSACRESPRHWPAGPWTYISLKGAVDSMLA